MSNTGDQQPPTGAAPKRYACRNCGHPYDAYPPDDIYKIARREPCEDGDSIPQNYECENCHETNVLYWDQEHIFIQSLGRPR